jgi:hypothetical protein
MQIIRLFQAALDTFANIAAPEAVFNLRFEVEHIVPITRGGTNDQSNLALSCRSCNLYKSNLISTRDEKTQDEIGFFNPRRELWTAHFLFDRKTGEIKALMRIGEATIFSLRINSSAQLAARIQWAKLGFFD